MNKLIRALILSQLVKQLLTIYIAHLSKIVVNFNLIFFVKSKHIFIFKGGGEGALFLSIYLSIYLLA